ncbi:sigma-70 RNA polymerase sigma factor region 4 domain-containing protein [Granulicella paludicola]|uniref:sigma factor-like helix-turn-helix DNA-binding protein n=1 Tax=Granulicella paludicola TaxID=474951 RepID=UPI0021E0152B|nr:sigma factor-like helix-turn-helix DNA-binding protein [Granulicella paludicola]
MKASLPNDHFFSLCDARDEDAKQDQYLALLEAQPQSEADARAILKTLHHRHERARRNRRKRGIQLDFDPPAPQIERYEEVTLAISSLSAEEGLLIEQHVFEEMSLRSIADHSGVPRETLRRRYNNIKAKLALKISQ